jgi:hypothetical protein
VKVPSPNVLLTYCQFHTSSILSLIHIIRTKLSIFSLFRQLGNNNGWQEQKYVFLEKCTDIIITLSLSEKSRTRNFTFILIHLSRSSPKIKKNSYDTQKDLNYNSTFSLALFHVVVVGKIFLNCERFLSSLTIFHENFFLFSSLYEL